MLWRWAAVPALVLLAGSAFAEQRIDSISPAEGPIAGGTVVSIRGAGFATAAVSLDHVAATPLSRSDSEIQLQMPKHDNGYALIQIGSAAAEFLYLPPKLEDLPPGFITTVAGVGKYVRVEFPATQSMLSPSDVTIAPDGDIYFMQTDRGLLFRLSPDGILHHVAGTLGTFDTSVIGDGGPAVDAVFSFARSVAVDAARNAYITDVRSRVRKVDGVTGIVTTVAGTGEFGFSGDGGPATQAKIGEPSRIACAADGTLYFLDGQLVGGGGSPRVVRVRKVTPSGTITTVAGDGTIGESGDGGPATAAQLNVGVTDVGDVALDADQNVFILEHDGARIRRVDAHTGIITTFASLLFPAGDPRNNGTVNPAAIAIDSAGNVWAAIAGNLRKLDRNGNLLGQWGNKVGFSPDGTSLTQMSMDFGAGMAVAANGDVVYGAPGRLRRISAATQKVETIAGMGNGVIGVPGRALGAVFTGTWGDVAVLPTGDLVFCSGDLDWIFRLQRSSGMVVPFAGGLADGSGRYVDTPALQSTVAGIRGLKSDSLGNVYIADTGAVRVIEPSGMVHGFAGANATGPLTYDFAGDGGPAVNAHLSQPLDVAIDSNRNVYVADTNNNRIRRVDAVSGIITTVAGSGAVNGFEGYGRGNECGDGGPATSACLNTPIAVAVRSDGTMYINDFGYPKTSPVIRKVAPDGTISSLGWPGSTKLIAGPGGSIFGHAFSRVYRADDDRVRFLAGTGVPGFAGDGGTAVDAQIAPGETELANGLAIDAEGNLFIDDAGNHRIRAIRFGAVLAPPNARIEATAAGTTIRATVFDADGYVAPGVRVDFSAPSSGPSCHFPNGAHSSSVVTDAKGVATAICSADCGVSASFVVSAQPLTATSTARVTVTDTGVPCRRRAARR